MRLLFRTLTLFLLILSAVRPAAAWYPRGAAARLDGAVPVPVIGGEQVVFCAPGDTLVELARANGLGFTALAAANPGVDPWLPERGRPLHLPYGAVFPGQPTPGITVNLAEMRLYLVWRQEGTLLVRIYPLGVGDQGWETPEGVFAIRSKIRSPVWAPPPSIRRERPDLPARILPGEDNPLGDFWLGFTPQGHGLHGTNEPYGVGRRVSHGCLRLYPEDIRDLFSRVTVGTPVRVIYQPLKVGVHDGALYLEAHRGYRGEALDGEAEVRRQAAQIGWRGEIDGGRLRQVLRAACGIPAPVSRPPAKEVARREFSGASPEGGRSVPAKPAAGSRRSPRGGVRH